MSSTTSGRVLDGSRPADLKTQSSEQAEQVQLRLCGAMPVQGSQVSGGSLTPLSKGAPPDGVIPFVPDPQVVSAVGVRDAIAFQHDHVLLVGARLVRRVALLHGGQDAWADHEAHAGTSS